MNSSEQHERLMSNPEFWDMFLPLFFDEEKLREFATITGLTEQRIRAARDEHAKNAAPHFHRSNGTIN